MKTFSTPYESGIKFFFKNGSLTYALITSANRILIINIIVHGLVEIWGSVWSQNLLLIIFFIFEEAIINVENYLFYITNIFSQYIL